MTITTFNINKSIWRSNAPYTVSCGGEIFTSRERGVKLGDIRLFMIVTDQFKNESGLFYVESIDKSNNLFKAPYVRWRKIEINFSERLTELEKFVDRCAKVKNYEGWQGKYFQRAREISKKGFLMKLKGEDDERQ